MAVGKTAEDAARLVVAIDGPSGAGKSTVAKRLARDFHFMYLDTGAMYRAVAWKALEQGIDPGDGAAVKRMLPETRIELRPGKDGVEVLLDGADVSRAIRTPEVGQAASKISVLRTVRERMVELQREAGSAGGVVAEGRDTTTVVFPRAEVKVFLDASLAERARRRFEELRGQGAAVSFETTMAEIEERDRRDTERALAPLTKAEDAIVIDSTHCTVEAVVARIAAEIRKRLLVKRGGDAV